MKLLIALGTAAILTSACAASATVSGSHPATVKTGSTVKIGSGADAGSAVNASSDDVNHVNHPEAGVRPIPPAESQAVIAQVPAPALGSGADRCSAGFGVGPGGNATTTGQPKHRPLPLCPPE